MIKKTPLNIAIIQLTSTDDVHKNQSQILKLLNDVPFETDIVFLPENALFMKISNHSPKLGIALDDPVYEPFIQWARKTSTHVIFGANPTAVPGGVANATIWVDDSGRLQQCYSKIHLFDVDVEGHKPVRESDQFVAGSERNIIEIEGWKIGLSICYDVRFPELYLEYAKKAVDIIAVPAAFLVPTGKAHWHVLLRARAIESQCFVVAAAQAGDHYGVDGAVRHSFGHSMVISPWGGVLQELDGESEAIGLWSLDHRSIDQVRAQIPMASHRKL